MITAKEAIIVRKETGAKWRVRIKKGYYFNPKPTGIEDLVLKDVTHKSFWQRIRDLMKKG